MEIEIERGAGKGGGGPSECLESEEWMLRRRYRSGGKGGRREQRSTERGLKRSQRRMVAAAVVGWQGELPIMWGRGRAV